MITRSKITSLVMALGLMLGLAVTGCTDKDRDVVESKYTTVNYEFEQEVAEKVAADATNVLVTAYADDTAVSCVTAIDTISEMVEGTTENSHVVTSIVDSTANVINYYFYKVGDDDQKVITGIAQIDVNLAGVETYNAVNSDDDMVEITAKAFNADGEEATEFVVNDTLNVKAYVDGEEADLDIVPENLEVVAPIVGAEGVEFGAVAEGETTFAATIEGMKVVGLAPITVTAGEDPTSKYTAIYVVPSTFSVNEDGTAIVDENGEEIAAADLPTAIQIAAGAEKEFVVIGETTVNEEDTATEEGDEDTAADVTYEIVNAEEIVYALDAEAAESITLEGNIVTASEDAEVDDAATLTATYGEGEEALTSSISIVVAEEEPVDEPTDDEPTDDEPVDDEPVA